MVGTMDCIAGLDISREDLKLVVTGATPYGYILINRSSSSQNASSPTFTYRFVKMKTVAAAFWFARNHWAWLKPRLLVSMSSAEKHLNS